MPDMSGGGGGGAGAGDIIGTGPVAANAKRGFLITVRCTTPNANAYQLVDSTFITNLM